MSRCFSSAFRLLLPAALLLLNACSPPEVLTDGPFIGHTDADSLFVYARASRAGTLRATLAGAPHFAVRSDEALAGADHMVHFSFTGLAPDCEYTLQLWDADGQATAPRSIRTDAPHEATIAFASCANDLKHPSQPIWDRLRENDVRALVLLGDTPYIDSTDLAKQRARRRAFHRVPELRALLRQASVWTTWDDHDFGKNDTDGKLKGKEHSRQALLEWSALDQPGSGSQGIYTSFRRGPCEVFLLDTRTFSNTTKGADGLPTLLGSSQWEWLLQGLRRSEAPFKLIASSMVWNGAVRPLKTDMWTNWPHERERLWNFIGDEGIEGVVLLSGDVHRTRVFAHSTQTCSGYRLREFITSPAAQDPHENAKQPHPDLIFDAGVPAAALILHATDDGRLRLRNIDARGETLRGDVLNTSQLIRGGEEPLLDANTSGQWRVVRGGELQLQISSSGTVTQLRAPGQRNLLALPWPVEANPHTGEQPAPQGPRMSWGLAGPWTTLSVEFPAGSRIALPPLALALTDARVEPSPAGLCVRGDRRGRRVGLTVLARGAATVLPAPVFSDGQVRFPAATLPAEGGPASWTLVLHSRVPLPDELNPAQ